MAKSLHHRGPDAAGVHVDGSVALAHARLSILDLRPEANQPMISADGQVAVVFNGEIYNFNELGAELAQHGVRLKTRCDTEVLLELYRHKGPACVNELRGMFAFAIWDRRTRTLMMARDRVGQKPLYYHAGRRGFSFASEVRTLLLDDEVERNVDVVAMTHYMSLGFVPSSQCLFSGVKKVLPGHYVLLRDGKLESHRYWKLDFADYDRRPVREVAADLRDLLDDAVRARMIADVPLGAFLSGGVDSSAIVALMARHSPHPVKTFSIGFDDADFSELEYARLVAEHCRTEHYEEIVRPDAAALLPTLVEQYGEPFSDPSAVPTYCLSRMTRKHVTVSLSGDGGDETFAGYTRYAYERGARLYGRLPKLLVQPIAQALERLPNVGARRKLRELFADIRHRAYRIQLSPEMRYVAEFGNFNRQSLERVAAQSLGLSEIDATAQLLQGIAKQSSARNAVDLLLDIDSNSYLPDDIFVKVDIASMAHSLEVRSPIVDHHVLEFAARLPPSLKLHGFRGKRIFREAVRDLLPPAILRRRKRGFGIPHARWLRGDLRSLARDALLSPQAIGRGYFEREGVKRLLDEHDSGAIDHGLRIWNLLWLELWHRRYIDRTDQRGALRAGGQ